MLTSTKATYNTSFEFATVQGSNDSAQQQEHHLEHDVYDVSKNTLREQCSAILDILLIDRTASTVKTTKNIIWANEHYIDYDKDNYATTAHIKPELITGKMCQLIMPRALKSREQQKERTKSKAEVFTPTWNLGFPRSFSKFAKTELPLHHQPNDDHNSRSTS